VYVVPVHLSARRERAWSFVWFSSVSVGPEEKGERSAFRRWSAAALLSAQSKIGS
jgi:hypothetical protein